MRLEFLGSNDTPHYEQKPVGEKGVIVTYPNKVGPSVLYDSSTRNLSHYCGLSKITGRMFTETDFVRLEERNPNGTDRRFTCEDDFAGQGDKCTHWVITVNGDNHVFNRDVSPGATCFEL
ncbi:MAG: hypothetical protein MK135_10615 [Polyangiaceae bacterium]|nr:hypothetical protein [Polyangiaceae bacterium]